MSNNVARWLTVNGDYIQVDGWNNNLNDNPEIINAVASCEVQYVNSKSGDIGFSFDYGLGWSDWKCQQRASQHSIYFCDLRQYGLDAASKVNDVKIKCRMSNSRKGSIGFSVDSIQLDVAVR